MGPEGQDAIANETSVQIQTTTDSNSDPPPDGGYGWVQVGVAFTINAFTWGQTAVRSSFPLFRAWSPNTRNSHSQYT
jgi:hypothetical protein